MTYRTILSGLFLAAAGMAQVHGGGYRGGYGTLGPVGPIGQGFGNVVFPGGGIAPSASTGHAAALGATVRGVYPAPGPRGQYGVGGVYRNRNIIPVAVPVFVGGYGYGYDYSQQAPNVTVINAPPQTPTVIINQNYTPDQVRPVMRDYTRESLPETPQAQMTSYQAPIPSNPEPAPRQQKEDTPTIYLISLRDGTVYSCYAYWVENDTLHYITTRHSHNKASMDMVDVEVSEQLNRERRVEFKLKPAAAK